MDELSMKLVDDVILTISKYKGEYLLKFENTTVIYQDLLLRKSVFKYYLKLFQVASNLTEVYNIYLLAQKNLKIGDIININGKMGIIAPINKNYFGIYYNIIDENNEPNNLDYLMDESDSYTIQSISFKEKLKTLTIENKALK